jgi:hypothetical protein
MSMYLEDLISVIDGRETIVDEIREAGAELSRYVGSENAFSPQSGRFHCGPTRISSARSSQSTTVANSVGASDHSLRTVM